MRYRNGLTLMAVAIAVFSYAEEPATPEKITAPGVLLTFDDTYVDQWLSAVPLFKEYNAQATFFVTHFDKLTPDKRDGLHQLHDAGHAIGCHGLRHIRATEHTEKHGAASYMAKEIAPALAHMAEAEFVPTSFAYPMSDNNATTDAALLTTFKHLRTGTGAKEGQRFAQMDLLFTPLADLDTRRVLTGKGIDRIGYPGNEDVLQQLFEAMDRAVAKNEVLTLYAHGIAESGKHHHIRLGTLEKILAYGKEIGLRFYTFDDLP